MTQNETCRSPEVLVVGAGPAGLATAIACAQRGVQVVIIERRETLPIDKACGEGLMPDAVEHLAELGVHPRGCALEGIRYTDGVHSVYGAFDASRRYAGRGTRERSSREGQADRLGLGVRRTDLSKALRHRAEELGVVLVVGDSLKALSVRGCQDRQSPGGPRYRVDSESGSWTPQVVVGADGLRSKLRQQAGLENPSKVARSRERFGVRRHFQALEQGGMEEDSGTAPCVEVFWADGTEAYVTPVGGGMFGVAFLFLQSPGRGETPGQSEQDSRDLPGGELDPGDQDTNRVYDGPHRPKRGSVFERHVAKFPELQRRLAACEPVTRVRGAGPLHHRARRHAVGNLALVGDAGGYVDAITGEGLAIAFAEAVLVARCIAGALRSSRRKKDVCSALVRYHRDASRRRMVPEMVTRGALALSRRPWLRRRFLRALERQPAAFDRVLALHTRAARDVAALPLALELSWRIAVS